MSGVALLCVVLALGFANGANDNFKGVATLHGSGRLGYRRALALAALTTLAGSLAAAAFGAGLARRFSGRGLVPDAIASEPAFVLAVGLGAAATVLLATRLGFPVSTTHALAGGLLGAGVQLAGADAVAFGALSSSFLLPLLASPLLALGLTAVLRPAVRRLESSLATDPPCLCLAPALELAAVGPAFASRATPPRFELSLRSSCERHGARPLASLRSRAAVDALHVASAGAVGFARGLNDAPKMAGLLFGVSVLGPGPGGLAVALAIVAGGLIAARRVARTLAFGITEMSGSEGLSANLVTAALVTLASPFGLPVSTTHVSCGALFGIGAANGAARWRMVAAIAGAWAITLPVAALLSGSAAAALSAIH